MPEQQYDPSIIEAKWQAAWDADPAIYAPSDHAPNGNYYVVEMLPYPSGKLHMGHVRNYSLGDTLARYMWMRGYRVLHPMGWDAYGLPAENAAIKSGRAPRDWTVSNIAVMKGQLKRLGFAIDWSREVATCDPEYYRWNQWFFLKMYERGLAYRKRSRVNWCPLCNTVLANEQVENGCCWRHTTTPVEQREIEQWFFKITHYAEELVNGLEKMQGWPERVRAMQRNWIGRSEGAEVQFNAPNSGVIRVFTTRIDTIFGATCVILAPEHELSAVLIDPQYQPRLKAMIDDPARKDPTSVEKDGFFTGQYAVNPFNGERIPIWIGNFVLVGYGTGAIMAVPAHDERDFEFCTKYGIPIVQVVRDGFLEGSGEYTGLSSDEAWERMTARAERDGFGKRTITYRLRDWGVSRQRYWGTPIPMIHCAACGVVPVPESDLPVLLPDNVEITGEGRSPLERVPEFMNVACPKCGAEARRESDTMDTFVDSSWYFYRYCDPRNREAPFDPKKAAEWMPMKQYIGGITHAIMHLLYSRYWTRVMRDLGMVDHDEPAENLFTQGMVLGTDGTAMSKSKGNVVDPDEMTAKYGADTCRLFTLFAAPPDRDMEWNESSVEGQFRFLGRVFRFVTRNIGVERAGTTAGERQALRKVHQTIAKITTDFDNRWHFNTSIAALMELSNELIALESEIPGEAMPAINEAYVKMLAPFAPYAAQELWSAMGREGQVFKQPWPEFDAALAAEDSVEIPVQVNGKLRGKIVVAVDATSADLEKAALADEKVRPYVDGKQVAKVIVVAGKLVNIVAR
ncbi:MAG: leucine--tRNA ligase [Bryobacteraceae bacterium]|nr:leucine--tRNA ligase [Bryobacteraceae bacterium]